MVGLKDFNMPSCCNSCGHWSFSNDDEPLCDLTYEYISQFDKKQDDCPLVEAIPKAEYEARLKSDMIALLTEIQTEIEELKLDYPVGECTHPLLKIKTTEYQTKTAVEIKHDCAEIIQQKLNALKEEDD